MRVYGTEETPLFVANDVGSILDIVHIDTTLNGLDEGEVCTIGVMDSLKRVQKTNMLTESGIYHLLCISRKPIAKQFRKFVFNMIKELRKNNLQLLK